MNPDEISKLQQELNSVKKKEEYFRCLFENAPVGLEMADFSEIKLYIEKLKEKGISDIKYFFEENRDELIKCHLLLETATEPAIANKEITALYQADSLENVVDELYTTVFTEDSFRALIDLFVAFDKGKKRFSTEVMDRDFKGNKLFMRITWIIAPGYEKNWGRVIYSVYPAE